MPAAGRLRPDIAPGLHILTWNRRITVFYLVLDDLIRIQRIFYNGQDYEKALRRNG